MSLVENSGFIRLGIKKISLYLSYRKLESLKRPIKQPKRLQQRKTIKLFHSLPSSTSLR